MKLYDIIWNTPSECAKDSMPLGGHDVGCNVWAEDNQVFVYFSQSGAFDENGCLLKLGRLRLAADPALMKAGFQQRLHLADGYVSITMGSDNDTLTYELWCPVTKSELRIRYTSSRKRKIAVIFDCWRYRDRVVTPGEVHQCRDYEGNDDIYAGKIYTRKDQVDAAESELLFYHQNRADAETLLDKLVKQQHAEPFCDKAYDCIGNRIIGGLIRMDGFRFAGTEDVVYANDDSRIWKYEKEDALSGEIVVTMSVNQNESLEKWISDLKDFAAIRVSHEDSVKWWNGYFEKSWICIDEAHPDSEYFKIGRNYQLFRYMLGCNFYGAWPTKFNGGLFTFDEGRTPDFRMWSGVGHTAQNQRLVYWPMLKSGDFEAMKPQFDYYKNITPIAKARTKHFYRHDGAYFFEQGNAFGMCSGMEYNWCHSENMDFGEIDNEWVRLHYSTGLEFALMILEYHRYSGKNIDEYLEFIESTVEFYAQHYPVREGKLFIFPSCALETYRGHQNSKDNNRYGCANPADAVSGLRTVTKALMEYFRDEPEKRARYEAIFAVCPDIPVAHDGDGKYFAPAESFNPTVFNCELPQLYPVYPYGQRGLSDEEKQCAINAYFRKYPSPDQYIGYGWHQNGIFAAKLNLLDEAEKYLFIKFSDAPKRFPAFWGPGHDWTPDHNHGGSGMILLQEMLLNCEGQDKVEFLPTWNKDIDVSFRLFVPGEKIAECEFRNGKFIKKEVRDAKIG